MVCISAQLVRQALSFITISLQKVIDISIDITSTIVKLMYRRNNSLYLMHFAIKSFCFERLIQFPVVEVSVLFGGEIRHIVRIRITLRDGEYLCYRRKTDHFSHEPIYTCSASAVFSRRKSFRHFFFLTHLHKFIF